MVLIHEYVTGGGLAGADLPASWAAEGNAMRRALAEDFASLEGVRVVMCLDDRLPDEPGPWTTLLIGPGQEPEVFATWAAAADHTVVVAPETEGRLLERARWIDQVGGFSLGSTVQGIEWTGRKDRLGGYWRASGIPTPLTTFVHPESGEARPPGEWSLSYPMVLKPIDGAGSVDTFLLVDADSLPKAAKALPIALLQPLVVGTPMSASFLVDSEGRPWLVGVGRQRMEVQGGRFQYRGGIVPEGPASCPAEVRRAVEIVPGLRGWVGVDYVLEAATGRAVLLEINPRVTTSYVGLRQLLPAGELARAWLGLLDPTQAFDPRELADVVHRSPPVWFEADGSIVDEGADS
ncbi:ATP-grasp domain-containing protein [soil metagenome]